MAGRAQAVQVGIGAKEVGAALTTLANSAAKGKLSQISSILDSPKSAMSRFSNKMLNQDEWT